MQAKAPLLQIANVIPVTYDAQVDLPGSPRGTCMPRTWSVANPEGLKVAVERQMELFSEEVTKRSQSRIAVNHCTLLSDLVIRRIELKTASKVYMITCPPRGQLIQPAEEAGAMRFFIWIVFDDDVYSRLPCDKKEPCKKGPSAWLPCAEKKELARQGYKSGLMHEFCHWLKDSVRKAGGKNIKSPHNKDKTKDYWGHAERDLKDAKIVRQLTDLWHPDKLWP